MLDFITSYWFLGLAVIAASALAVGGLLVVRRFVSHSKLERHHEVAGYFLTIIGSLYAVVLGFIVVGSVNIFDKARVTVEQEANSIHDIFHLAYGLDAHKKDEIRHLCLDYCDAMIKHEWTAMAAGTMSPEAHEVASKLWRAVVEAKPTTSQEENLCSALLSEMDQLSDARATRLVESARAYDPIIWGVLIIGAMAIIAFTYFFGVENIKVQIVMTIAVTLFVGLNMVVVAMFSYPYAGDVKVDAGPFVRDQQLFIHHLAEDH